MMHHTVIFGIDVINFIIIGLFLAIAIVYWSTKSEKLSKLTNFISLMSQFGILLFISQFVIQNQQRHVQEEKDKIEHFLKATERFTNNIENWFVNNYPYGTRLYKQLWPNHPGLERVETPSAIDKNKQAEFEAHGCALLIQAISDAYRSENLANTHSSPEYAGWMASCRRWFNSPILLKNWGYLKKNYGEEFQLFVDEELIKKNVS